jgi:hypothetical protein
MKKPPRVGTVHFPELNGRSGAGSENHADERESDYYPGIVVLNTIESGHPFPGQHYRKA